MVSSILSDRLVRRPASSQVVVAIRKFTKGQRASTADSRSPILDFFIPSRGAARHRDQPPELGNFFLANSLQGPTDGGPPASYEAESADRRRATARRSAPLTCSLGFPARAKRAANCERPAPAAWAALGLLADVDIISWRGFRSAARCGHRRRARRGQLRGQGAQQPDQIR
jgi:hypothetical protein